MRSLRVLLAVLLLAVPLSACADGPITYGEYLEWPRSFRVHYVAGFSEGWVAGGLDATQNPLPRCDDRSIIFGELVATLDSNLSRERFPPTLPLALVSEALMMERYWS